MTTYTDNYNLIKPSEEDYYDVTDFNENMDTVDALLAETEQGMEQISKKIGEPSENGQTVFSLLNSVGNMQFIKSIQHVTYTPSSGKTSGSVTISTVEPSKCIVIFERLKEFIGTSLPELQYMLNASSLSLTFESLNSSDARIYGFWIIEFY